jgi:NhaA family Na+:H+ antiporter
MPMPHATLDQRPMRRLLSPFTRFTQLESSGSIVLLLATLAALAIANSHFAAAYNALVELPMGARFGRFSSQWTLNGFINDGLMAIFFLVVGLEVKREILVGELASLQRALLPAFGALGGVLTPALIYTVLNRNTANARGWGVPIATDIAFSLAVLTVFGTRIPTGLKLFLVTLAIVDDVAGVVVIATAYTRSLHLGFVAVAVLIFALCLVLNRLGVIWLSVYAVMGVALWWALSESGIHPTLSGIVLALAVPSRSFMEPATFVDRGERRMRRLADSMIQMAPLSRESREHLRMIRLATELLESPLDRLQGYLHPWVSFVIVPLFAFTNAGIRLHGFHASTMLKAEYSGIFLGLLLGKPIGITAFSWIAVRLGFAELPYGVRWHQLHAVSWLGGIGFTVSIFIAGLAFDGTSDSVTARNAVLMASASAAVLGAAMLMLTHRPSLYEQPDSPVP